MSVVDDLIEVKLLREDNFLLVKETLTRIGIMSKKDKKLYQSCHILHKRGKYYIVHFKELFMLDGKESSFSEDDKGRRNKIAQLLEQWELVKIVDRNKTEDPLAPISKIKILPFSEKDNWELCSKYSIGFSS